MLHMLVMWDHWDAKTRFKFRQSFEYINLKKLLRKSRNGFWTEWVRKYVVKDELTGMKSL